MTFRKLDGGRLCTWDALRGKRTRVPGTTMASGKTLPHDVSTFVVEAELGLRHGFWGCVADGATFRTLGRRRTKPGRRVIQEHVAELDDAELRVNAEVWAWHQGVKSRTAPALDAMLARWQALPVDGELVLHWQGPDGPQLHPGDQRRVRARAAVGGGGHRRPLGRAGAIVVGNKWGTPARRRGARQLGRGSHAGPTGVEVSGLEPPTSTLRT